MRPLVAALFLAAAAAAQPDWSEVAPGLGVAAPLADGFGDRWEGGPGLVVRADVPAYGGRLHGAVLARAYEGEGEAPPFALVMPTAGWGPTVARGPVRLSAGPALGVALFRIETPRSGTISETEVAVGAWAHAAVRVGPVEVWAQADAVRLALAPPVGLAAVTGGLAVPVATPPWLRRLLR